MKKRLLSLFLVFVLVLGMLPLNAFAADEGETTGEEPASSQTEEIVLPDDTEEDGQTDPDKDVQTTSEEDSLTESETIIQIPEGAPFTDIYADNGKVISIADKGIVDFGSYTGVPYYHVVIPAGASSVSVTHPASANPLILDDWNTNQSQAYGYFTDTDSFGSLGYITLDYSRADNGDYVIVFPISYEATDYTDYSTYTVSFVKGDDALYAVCAEDVSYNPIALFTFEYDGAAEGGVTEAEVSGIQLDKESESLGINEDIQLNATVLPAEATGWTIEWSSSDEGVATVDQTGKVTAVGEGTATITAAIGDIKASCEITVELTVGGSFALMAVTSSGLLIEPCYVSYAAGATVKQALKGSGHTFEGIDSGFISAIDGVVDNYSLYYDNGGYSLDEPASGVTALWFTTNSAQLYSDDLLDLVLEMTRYNTATNGVKDYTAAKTAYTAAASNFYQTSAAATLCSSLKTAMDKFEEFGTADTVGVTLNVTMNDEAMTTGKAVFTSEFDTVHTFTDFNNVELAPAEYDFDISDGDFRHVRGSVTVTEDGAEITATVPHGNWIDSVDLSMGSGSSWAALDKSDVTLGSATFYVPDYADYSLYPYVTRNTTYTESTSTHKIYNGESTSARVWESYSTALVGVIDEADLEDLTLVIQCRQTAKVNGYQLYQTFTLNIKRVPTLSDLAISGDGTALKLDFVNTTLGYAVTTTSDSVDITPTALSAGASVTVNGAAGVSGQASNVPLSDCTVNEDGTYSIPVVVSAPNGLTTTYTVTVTKVAAVGVTMTHDSDVSVAVYNSAGALIAPITTGETEDTYKLVPGDACTYIATKNTYYHATASFTVSDGLTVAAATPKTADWATNIEAYSSSTASSILTADSDFSAADHTYTFYEESNSGNIRILAASSSTSTYAVTIYYTSHENSTYSSLGGTYGSKDYEKSVTSNTTKNQLSNGMGNGGWGNSFRVEYKQKTAENGVTYYQDYLLDVVRNMTLNTLSAVDNQGSTMVLTQSDGETTGFDKLVYGYTTSIGAGADKMTLTLTPTSSWKYDFGYQITVACGDWSETLTYSSDSKPDTVTFPLNGTTEGETVTITVAHEDETSIAGVYTIAVEKLPPITTTITVDPADAIIFLTEDATGERVLPEADGTFNLKTTASYTYVITRNGYMAQTASFTAGEDNQNITVTLAETTASSLTDISIAGDWLQFRADSNNNGVVNTKTPIKAEDAVLEWANKIGDGFDSGATGCPIIVGGYIYTYAGNSIVKVNKETGEVVASGTMAASSSFAINSPTYADGMIFVGLSAGRVQAFNADTLESLWLFKDALGGQPNCPIAYCDGYVYTGFWNSETKQAHFVCLSVADENPAETTESKLASWTYTHNGFYWAGAYACEDFVLIGTDDGDSGYTTGYASILSLDPKTGLLLDEEKLTNVGDQRSSICYDTATDAYYFTTKGGDFYQIKVNADGTFTEGSLRRLHLDNGSDNVSNPPMSTSTPVVYNGRAYIGVSGTSQFGAYSGHNITVIDLESFSIAYTVPTMGYPQTSGLLTTAYENVDGYVYVYFIDNFTPGMIRVIRDKKGMTEVDHTYTSLATITSNGETKTIETGYILFTPYGDEAQYAICSPITDSEGNLYFKNDTARMMRLSSRITSLEVTTQPEKLVYETGMTFDGEGMTVVAHYANGLSKDITKYLSYTDQELTKEDTEITVSYDLTKLYEKSTTTEEGYWQWYQDVDGQAGQPYYLPTATVTIELRDDHTWDAGQKTDATCTEDGQILYTCEVCGDTYTDTLTAPGHSFENGVCVNCGNADEQNVLSFYSISLTGDIALNYYMSLTDAMAADENAYILITYADGEQVKIPVTEGKQTTYNGNEYYKFAASVAAKEMTDDIKMQLIWENGSGKEYVYSIKGYADAIISGDYKDELKALVTAMLHYGAYAQTHFAYNTDKLANEGLDAVDLSAVTAEQLSGYTSASGQGTDLAKLYAASLILKSETTLRVVFQLSEGAVLTASYNGNALEVNSRSGLYYVDVTNISAKDLDEAVTITISDGTNSAEVVYNPMTYCYNVLNAGTFEESFVNVVKALYLYNQAANTYFEN